MIRECFKKIRVFFLNRKVEKLYSRYHRSFRDNIREAQVNRMLPRATIIARNDFNEAVAQLQALDPSTRWKKVA